MKTSCIVTPTIKVGNQEKDSRLFTELASYTGNDETAKDLWSLAQVKEFTDNLSNLEYDENGEITFDSFASAINIKEYLKGNISLQGLKREAGAVNKKGDIIKYDNPEKAIDKAVSFNKDNSNYVASVYKNDDGYSINVEKKDANNSDTPQLVVFHRALNNKLLGILRSVGFDIKIDENSSYAGIFNPLDTTTTVSGLRTIIQIAKGKRGEQAFPEEFAHAMIAGLGNHPLVIRLLNSLDMTTVEALLGPQFEEYNKKYEGDEERLKKEAAGKLLQEHIVGYDTPSQQKPLLSRIWNWIKSKLSNIDESRIDNAINEANDIAGELAEFILNEDVTKEFDEDLIFNEQPLYSLEKEVSSMESLADEALRLMSKRLKILSSKSKSEKYKKEDVTAIKELQSLIEKKKYVSGILHFLSESLGQISQLQKELTRLTKKDIREESDLNKIRSISYTLRSIKEFNNAYSNIIEQLTTLPSILEEGEINISEEDAQKIAEQATKIQLVINNINNNYKKLRFNTVYNFLKLYWGADKKINVGGKKYVVIQEKDEEGNIVEKKVEIVTLSMIMNLAFKDINGIDRWVSSLSDASDPMLSLVAKAVKSAHLRRDATLNKIAIGIRAAHKKLADAGYTTDFMYERDEKGKLTGRLISDIDFIKFNKERNAYIESLKKKGLKSYVIKSKIEAWDRRHTELVKLKGSSTERYEKLPIKSMYSTNVLSGLSKAQRDYYDTMIQAKILMEDQIPERYASTYNAVQISKDMTEVVTDNLGSPRKALKLIADRTKSNFIRKVDDTGFGDSSKTILDFNGNPVERLPVYYTKPLENTEMLSTDFTASILAYSSMAINYGEMNKIIDVLELTRDLIHDRDVQQTSGDNRLIESYKVLHKKFSKSYVKPGNKTNIGDRIDDYYESVIYDKQKKDEGTVTIKGKSIDVAKSLDSIKSYTGAVGLGLNLFSAISNVTVGKMQIWIESLGGEYFNVKNALVSKKNYYKDLPEYLAELNSVQKTNKMALLIDKFDALEEFYNSLQHEGYYKGAISRIIGKTNLFMLNNMGEHYLHTRTMLAMLDAYKVKLDGKEISLYDAMEVVEKDGEYSIEIKEGVTKLNGEPITEVDIDNLKMKIGKVNQSLNGAFNDADKGAIHRYALGRMAMQFRQWMPAHYSRRFASPYYDAELDQYREGYYRTLGRFSLELLKDIARAKFQFAINSKNLSEHEKANLKKALSEIAMFLMLSGIIMMMGPAKDRKGVWYERMILYQLKRMQLETGASTPVNLGFFKNIFTILKSPAPSIQSFNNLLDILAFWNIFNEIESGRYKGWSEYERDVTKVIPVYGQIRKVFDLSEEDYMFTIVNN